MEPSFKQARLLRGYLADDSVVEITRNHLRDNPCRVAPLTSMRTPSTVQGTLTDEEGGLILDEAHAGIMDSFNSQNSGPRILLLSLTAGKVELNLVGGNHLLLFEIHWNPQLETQMQDRIHRFGQKKDVHIYKFICVNIIEEDVKALRERKLEIAKNVSSGDRSATTKLTLNDLKSLFGF